jgi:hypothetical protein
MHIELIDSLLEGIAPVVVDLVAKQVDARVAALPAAKDGMPGPKGDPGEPGAKGIDGAPGKDAVVDYDRIGAAIKEVVAVAVAEIPAPKDGAPGARGEPGPAGKDADEGVIAARVLAVVGIPKDGEPGPKGERGERGPVGEKGEPGKDGKSATQDDIRAVVEPLVAAWALDFERRAQDVFAKAIERMPKPKDGIDGFSLEDLSIEHDGDGNVTLRFARGELIKEFKLRLPRFKDKGIYREEEIYLQGDGVTYGGSFSIAQKDGPQGRPGESDDWRLAVRKGRDGKHFQPPDGTEKLVRLE